MMLLMVLKKVLGLLLLLLLPNNSMKRVGHDAAAVVGVRLAAARGGVAEHRLVCDHAFAPALLSGWCCVDVVEESLKIVTWERAVHLLVGPNHQGDVRPKGQFRLGVRR